MYTNTWNCNYGKTERMTVNQKFIAGKAGVTQKTVSLFFQNSPKIAEKTRRKLEEIVKEYHYFPNLAARSIKTKKFKRIACIVIQHGSVKQFSHPQLMAYLNGAALELAQAGYSLVFEPVFVARGKEEIQFHEFFATLSTDGILGIAGGWIPKSLDEQIEKLGLPTVWLNREPESPDLHCIMIDEEKTALLLAEQLKRQGIRRIAWFGPEYEKRDTVHYSSRIRYLTLKAYAETNGMRLLDAVFAPYCVPLKTYAEKLIREYPDCDMFIGYNLNYSTALIHASIKKKINLESRVTHFASAWENTTFLDMQMAVMLPEIELGQQGARYLLSCLNGKPDDSCLEPLAGFIFQEEYQSTNQNKENE